MQDAAPGLGISLTELDLYLSTHLDGFARLRSVEKFADGQSNPTYKVSADSGIYVLRSKPAGVLLPSAHMVEREFRVLQALSATDVPVPRALHLAEAASPSGRSFYVMAYLDGRVFWDPALPEIKDRAAIYDAMNAGLAALHSVDLDAVGLADFGKPGNYFARQLDRWARQYRASVGTPLPDMRRIINWLDAQMPADDGQVSLVHGDYRLDNMIFAPDGAKILGILDWELSTLGHPMADLAYQCMQLRLPNQGDMRGLGGIDRAAAGIPSEVEYVAKYLQRRGLTLSGNWPFYLIFAFFRLAAILAGVVARAAHGNASNPKMARKYGSAIPALASMAAKIIDTET